MRKRTAKVIGISVGIAAIIAAGLGVGISVSGILDGDDASNELNVHIGNVNDADTQRGDENGSDGVHSINDDTEDDVSTGDANGSSTSATQNGGTSETTSEIATDDTIEQDVDTTLEVTDKLTKDASTDGVEKLLEYADVADIESKQDTLSGKIDSLLLKPASKWEDAKWIVISVVITAVATWLLSNVGL